MKPKNIDVLVFLGYNTGNEVALDLNPRYSKSEWMVELMLNELGVKYVVAASGNVNHNKANGHHV